jgi:2-polyprenyl-3-methyl-5-hydroxy-6-metoxy-1,4-benzoquinol methylase
MIKESPSMRPEWRAIWAEEVSRSAPAERLRSHRAVGCVLPGGVHRQGILRPGAGTRPFIGDVFRGKRVLDVGCGLAPDTVHYAEHGARVTFLDVVESNVGFAERVCRIKGIQNAAFCYMRDLDSLRSLPADYDVIYCCGTLIHAPLEVARMEAQALLRHLPVGGRWIELGYPVEWHDPLKLDYMLAPATFDTVLYLEFHKSDFNWFDLVRRT